MNADKDMGLRGTEGSLWFAVSSHKPRDAEQPLLLPAYTCITPFTWHEAFSPIYYLTVAYKINYRNYSLCSTNYKWCHSKSVLFAKCPTTCLKAYPATDFTSLWNEMKILLRLNTIYVSIHNADKHLYK